MSKITKQVGKLYLGDEKTKEGSECGRKNKEKMQGKKLDFDEEEGCWQVFCFGRNGLKFYPRASNAEENEVAADSGDDNPEGPLYVIDVVNDRLVKYIKSTREMSYWNPETKEYVEFFSQFIEDLVIMDKHHLETCDLSDDPDENDGEADDVDDDEMGYSFEENCGPETSEITITCYGL